MKIVESCESVVKNKNKTITEIIIGTVFLYGSHVCGPYLKIERNVIDLRGNTLYPDSSFGTAPIVNYLELPDARLVLK